MKHKKVTTKKKTILHFYLSLFPHTSGSSVRARKIAEEIKETEIIVFSNTYDEKEVVGQYYNVFSRVIRYSPRSLSSLANAFIFIIKKRPDKIILHNYYALLIFALLIKPFVKSLVAFEFHNPKPISIAKRLLLLLFLNRCDQYIYLSNSSKDYCIKYFRLSPNRIHSVSINGATYSFSGNTQTIESRLFKMLDRSLEKKYIFVTYAGSFHYWQGVYFLLDAFINICMEDCEYEPVLILAGSIDHIFKSKLNQAYVQSKYRICYLGSLESSEYGELISASHILCLPRLNLIGTETVISLKLVDYASTNNMIVCSDTKANLEYLRHRSDTYFFTPDNSESLTYALQSAIQDASLQSKFPKSIIPGSTWTSASQPYVSPI
jgi:glycosyltransferase involved in cell wall biosynthesis